MSDSKTSNNTTELWNKYIKQKDMDARNELVIHYNFIVRNIVYRMMPSYSKFVELDDLMSAGVLGLINAVSRFDINKGVNFETYAYHRVKGAVLDYLRKQDFVSSNLRQKIKEVDKAYAVIEAEKGRPATEDEVSSYLNISIDELRKILDNSYTSNVCYLDELLANKNVEPESKNIYDIPEEYYEENEIIEILKDCIDSLNERERLVVTLYYYEKLTLKEIGAVLDISESRVSQIHSKCIFKMRSKFNLLVKG